MADGSIVIDTKINEKGLNDGIKDLKSAIDQLSQTIQGLSKTITTSFGGINGASQTASENVRNLSDSYRDAEKSAEELRKEAEKIPIDRGENTEAPAVGTEQRTAQVDPSSMGYDQSAIDFIDRYAQGVENADQETNKLYSQIKQLQSSLKEMEKQGIWFGDDAFDEAYIKLSELKKEAADYKINLIDPVDETTMEGQIEALKQKLLELKGLGLGFGDSEYDETYRKLAVAKEEAKLYAAELAKTPRMIEAENQKQAESQAKLERKLEAQRAITEQEQAENERLNGIAQAATVSSQKIIDLRKKLASLESRQSDLSKAGLGLGNTEFDSNVAQIAQLKSEISDYQRTVISAGQAEKTGGLFSTMAGKLKGLASNILKVTVLLGKMAGSSILGGFKKISAGILGINKSANKSTLGIGKILKYALGIRSMYALIGKLRSGIVDGFKNLAQYSSGTNQAISSLMSSLTQLKNSFATAFAPILSAVAPALNYLIGLLNAAVTAIAQFFAALTGQKTFTRATKVQQDYAKSLKKTGGAAKKAKGELASFDKLTVLNDKDSGSGSGGGGVSPSDMFETVAIESRFKEMADKIRGFIKNQDWAGLGAYMASGINAGLQKIYDAISWDKVGPKITYFANAFTQTFNSLVDNIDWDLLGRVLGAGINTLVNTVLLFVDGIDWKNLGAKIAIGANGLVDEINWENLGRLFVAKFNIIAEMLYGFVNGNNGSSGFNFRKLGESLGEGINGAINSINPKIWAGALSGVAKGILDTLSGIMEKTNWQTIGTKVAEFIGAIDWSGLTASLSRGIGNALGALSGIIIGFIKPAWQTAVKWWKDVAFQDGKFTIQGLLNGILQAIYDIGNWITNNIFKPFITGFKNAFGIHSPSTVMAEMGGYLIDGLVEGIKKAIPSVIEKFSEIKTKILDKLGEIKDGMHQKFSEINTDSENSVSKLKNTILDSWDELKTKTSETWKNIGTTVKNAVKNIGQKAGSIASGIGIGVDTYSIAPALPQAKVSLPHLASGTVVPPRAGEFAAILGDNRRETEVVSPLSTMKQALLEALREAGFASNNGEITLNVNLDGRQIYKTVVDMNRANTKMTGRNAFTT